MKLIYVAGPYRADNAWEVEQNIRRAEELAFRVAEAGAMPACPHTMTRYWDGTLTDEFWLEGTLELLRRCDAVVLVHDWGRSVGTRGELAEAQRLDIPVFYSLLGLTEWLEEQS
jgi:nucleoside 2-deoxyribosyltransferase